MSAASASLSSKTKSSINTASVDALRKMKSQNKTNIRSIISELKISPNMSEKDIKRELTRYMLKDQFNKLRATGVITGDGDSFIIGSRKGTKMEIIEFLIQTKKDEINALVNDLYDSVQKNYQVIQNKIQINTNKQNVFFLKKENKAFQQTRRQLVEDLHKRNQKLIDAVYKQGRLESGMRSQQSKILFQKDNLGTKFQQIRQNYESQIIKNQNQIIMRDLQIQANEQYREKNRHHLSLMFQNQRKAEIDDSDQKDQVELLQKRNALLLKLLNENKAIRGDLNKGAANIMEILRRNGLDVRNITQEQATRLQSALTDAAARVQGANQAARDAINAAFNKATNQLNGTINDAGRAQIKAIDDINDLLQNMRKRDADMNDILNKPRPPPKLAPDGMPWSCKEPPCKGTWKLITRNAKSIMHPNDGLVTIWKCSYGGHFCASNDEHGDWTGQVNWLNKGSWRDVHGFFTGVSHEA
jgi:hypothetical protein